MLHNHLLNFTSHELPVYFHPADQADHRTDGVNQFRPRLEIRGDHLRGFGDARLPVSLCVGTYHGGKYSRRQEDFLSHCDLFLMPGGGWIVRLSRLVNNLKF